MTFIPSSYSCPAGVGLMLPLIGDSIFSVFFVDTARPVILKRAKLLRQYSFYYPSYILASSTSLSALMDEICSMKTNDWEYLGTQAGRVIGLPSWRLDSGNLFVFHSPLLLLAVMVISVHALITSCRVLGDLQTDISFSWFWRWKSPRSRHQRYPGDTDCRHLRFVY